MTETTPYLFTDEGLAQLHGFIDRSTLFAFDLDGTLAPIVAEPGNIRIPESILAELIILNKWASVAVITGRSRYDALFHLGFVPKYLVGNHGAEGLPGLEVQEEKFLRLAQIWEDQLHAMLLDADQPGLFIENKGTTISIHYRNCIGDDTIHSRLINVVERLDPHPRCIGGKCVENLIPAEAPDKGFAMKYLMRQAGYSKGFFVGDDKTDEVVFELPGDNIFTVRVGNESGTKARYILQDQQEIPRLLREINAVRSARHAGVPG
ncbi:MAG: trehalose-phosphatase [Syntrophaceae bacterium]|nr:trehalose-phosphatase [Syntrophaceae bacterium]